MNTHTITTATVAAEWAPHKAMWIAFPSAADLWCEDLEPAQEEVAALVRAMATVGGERVRLLVMGDAALAAAQARLGDLDAVEIIPAQFGDIWLRDTGPIFTRGAFSGKVDTGFPPENATEKSTPKAELFKFNGWGGKYILPHDDKIGAFIADRAGVEAIHHTVVLEGGALDHDGAGTVLTTRQCLLNSNRNPNMTLEKWERVLAQALGARRVIWLGDGLENDHTDGHVDNLARFIAPGKVVIPHTSGTDDPNAAVFAALKADLETATDAEGRELEVVTIPSPGRIEDDEGGAVPASHMNFIICNRAVIMPTYDDRYGPQAVEALKPLFPGRTVIGLPSNGILTGGGSFHCITQQEPL